MSVATEMTPDWKHWEGDIVDGEFPLEQFLGAGEQGAVFRTSLPSGDGAIKLVPAGDLQAERLLERWNRARAFDHPHLISIVRTGTWVKAGMPLAYLVMECADENLAAVLVQRPLTVEETLEMLPPIAQALAFLHRQGLVHGRLKPSNILAVKDTLKISSDAVSAGDASADLQGLTGTIVHALTQQPVKFLGNGSNMSVIDSLPEPFREIARNCTGRTGRVRWSAAELADWLQSQKEAASAPATAAGVSRTKTKRSALTYYVIGFALILVGVIAAGGLLRHRISGPVSAVPPPAKPPEQISPPTSPPTEQPARAREPRPEPVLDPQEQVARQVLPDIPAEARRTVNGRATVVVRVAVDQSGRVTDAVLQPGGSRYFGKLALEAARNWRFAAGNGAASQEWFLRFEITRTDTKVFLEKSPVR